MKKAYICTFAPDSDLARLCTAASRELEREDRALQAAFEEGAKRGHYGEVGQGLTYWLYETTLVYIIFRAWIPIANVAWEHAIGSSSTRPSEISAGRRGASEKCDLMLLDDKNAPQAAFEAKWWNSSSAAAGALLLEDAAKLRRTCEDLEKYLLAFWWGTDAQKDMADATAFCEMHGLWLRYADTFGTTLRRSVRGYFALSVIEVK